MKSKTGKAVFISVFCAFSMFAVDACGKEDGQRGSNKAYSEILKEYNDRRDPSEAYEAYNETMVKGCDAEEAYVWAYNEILKNYDDKVCYKLIYLNDDDIPELAVISDCAHVSGADVYAYLDGKATQLYVKGEYDIYTSFGEYGTFLYNERQGLVWHIHSRNGGSGEDSFICQWDGTNPEMKMLHSYSINVEFYDDGGYNTEYVVDDRAVTYEEYDKATEQLDNVKQFDYVRPTEDLSNNRYFNPEIDSIEYSYCEELQFDGKIKWETNLLECDEYGSLYKAGFDEIGGSTGSDAVMINEEWELFFWVTADSIYYISYMSDEERKLLTDSGTLPESALLVCQEEELPDKLSEGETGCHEWIEKHDGDIICYRSFSIYDGIYKESRDILQFVWKKDAGLIGFRYARTPAGGGSLIIWNPEYLQREEMGFDIDGI